MGDFNSFTITVDQSVCQWAHPVFVLSLVVSPPPDDALTEWLQNAGVDDDCIAKVQSVGCTQIS